MFTLLYNKGNLFMCLVTYLATTSGKSMIAARVILHSKNIIKFTLILCAFVDQDHICGKFMKCKI